MFIPILEIEAKPIKQKEKILEEVGEFLTAKNDNNELEEAWDVIQSILGYMQIKYGNGFMVLSNALHNKKLRQRADNGGYKIKGKYKLIKEENTNE